MPLTDFICSSWWCLDIGGVGGGWREGRRAEWDQRRRALRPVQAAGLAGGRVCPRLAVGQSLPDGHLDTTRGHRKSGDGHRKWAVEK